MFDANNISQDAYGAPLPDGSEGEALCAEAEGSCWRIQMLIDTQTLEELYDLITPEQVAELLKVARKAFYFCLYIVNHFDECVTSINSRIRQLQRAIGEVMAFIVQVLTQHLILSRGGKGKSAGEGVNTTSKTWYPEGQVTVLPERQAMRLACSIC